MRRCICRWLMVSGLLALAGVCALAQNIAISATLVRKDRLPDLPAATGYYTLNALPATETRFLLSDVHTDHALPGGHNAANYRTCRWNAFPPADAVAETCIAGIRDRGTDPTGTVSALLLASPLPGKTAVAEKLYVFKDLASIAVHAVDMRGLWIAGVYPDGQVLCRRDDTPGTGYFFVPGKVPLKRTYPGTFLYWDAPRNRAVTANDRTITVLTADKRPVFSLTLPFVVTKATVFSDGRVLAGSQPIGRGGPSWRALISPQGKLLEEAVFGEWQLLPNQLPLVDEKDSLTATRQKRLELPYFVTFQDGAIEVRYKNSLLLGEAHPASNALCPATAFDARENIYTLMNEAVTGEDGVTAGYRQSVTRTRLFPVGKTRAQTLISGEEVAQALDWSSAFIYSLAVSPDGTALALTVTPDNERSYTEWWLLQYTLTHPKPTAAE